ncbi:MAG: DUF6503 family protein [Cyclobacteriaceae bacterium]|jgi:hypothetical protein|nr:hypothetical protein [Flammeovirgaceae bacterium]
MNKALLVVIGSCLLLISCNQNNPQQIVDKAIAAAGGELYLNSTIEFDFRGRHYVANRKGGKFSYERIFKNDKDSTQLIHDFVNNEGFRRTINDTLVEVPDTMKVKYTASVNSVLYFALLPYGLNDPSVKKKWLGETELQGNPYYKIEITFQQDGGGEDFEDTFIYWIDKSDYTIGYLAYSFQEDGKADCRFRKSINPRVVDGVRFSDYINYTPKETKPIAEMETLYKSDALKELSKIENTNLVVRKN